MKELKIEYKSIIDLQPYKNNARTHSDDQITQIVNSINRRGWTNPILIDGNNGIIAGHGRLLAAKKLGLDKVPAIDLGSLSDAEKAEYIIADNKIAENAGWDYQLLNVEFQLLEDAGIDPKVTGFSEEEINAICNPEIITPGLVDDDEVPEAMPDPITKLSDVWILDKHRLICGDATMIDNVEKLMNGEKTDMVFTDPPYGVDFQQGKHIGRNKKGKDRNFEPIANDEKKGDDLKAFIKSAISNAVIVSDVCSIYVWSPPLLEGAAILQAVIESGWHVQSQIIWNKTPFVIGRADYHWKHEICWYGYKGEKHQWYGGRDKSTIWDCPKIHTSDLHPTMKPVQLAEIACNNSTKIDDCVLDLFGGSGSTLIACEKTNRKCFMMELAPQYCDVIIRRWQKFTGKKAILESTQQTFDEVMNG
jgi:DNA modification methylase